MAKSSAASVLIYTTVALLLLLLLLSQSHDNPKTRRPHRRLKLRSSSSAASHSIPFDPIISQINQRREDLQWERSHSSFPNSDGDWDDDLAGDEDYLNDEERFNLTARIGVLFPEIDVEPCDGFVSSGELTGWNFKQAFKEVVRRSERELELSDRNRDGFIAFGEYKPPAWARKEHGDSNGNEVGWWKEDHFNASDVDGNGLLNLTEFNDFLHPADSSNPRLIQWLCKEEIRIRDKDQDGKLSFQEYFEELYDIIREYDEDHNSSDQLDTKMEAQAKRLFLKLDQNSDGALSEDELKPVVGDIHHSEHYYAKQQADYVLSQADSNKDGLLSLKEMIEDPYVFYDSILYDEDEYGYHDEFR